MIGDVNTSPTQSVREAETPEDRVERWIDWTQRAWSHCPLSLYDEYQKLGEIAVEEMLAERATLLADRDRLAGENKKARFHIERIQQEGPSYHPDHLLAFVLANCAAALSDSKEKESHED